MYLGCNDDGTDGRKTKASVALNEQETKDLLEWERQVGLSNIREEGSKCLSLRLGQVSE